MQFTVVGADSRTGSDVSRNVEAADAAEAEAQAGTDGIYVSEVTARPPTLHVSPDSFPAQGGQSPQVTVLPHIALAAIGVAALWMIAALAFPALRPPTLGQLVTLLNVLLCIGAAHGLLRNRRSLKLRPPASRLPATAALGAFALLGIQLAFPASRGASSIWAGQFLARPGGLFAWASGPGFGGGALLVCTLLAARARYLQPLMPDLKTMGYLKGLGVAGLLGLGLTFLLTLSAVQLFGFSVSAVGGAVDGSVAQAAGWGEDSQGQGTSFSASNVGTFGLRAAVTAESASPRAKAIALVVLVVVVILLVIGSGYAFTLMNLSFPAHFLAYSTGVAFPEELTKALAGLAVLYWAAAPRGDTGGQGHQRRIPAAFAIAGLGFGASEALEYFGRYAAEGSGFGIYIVRAVWCVTLHGSWAAITGRILAWRLPETAKQLKAQLSRENPGAWYWPLLAACLWTCIPSVLLHGLYDACCIHDSQVYWLVGGASIVIAMGVLAPSPARAGSIGMDNGPVSRPRAG